MGKSNTASNSILNLLFNATTWANVAQNATSGPITNLYVALHTANPGASGTQSTNEAAYTGYARVAVVRTSSGWTVSSAQSTSPVANIQLGICTAGTETETYASIGTLSSGAGTILYSGPITPSIAVAIGVMPILTTATTVTES